MLLSSVELVRGCQRTLPDDTRTFEALVDQYKERVFATSLRLMGNYHDAEELAQEVFLKVFHGIKGLDDPATLGAWIYRITANTCFDALEKRNSRRTTSLDADQNAETLQAEDGALTPEENALRRELRRCLESTLRRLDPAQRVMLVLRDVEGRPYQEIADSLTTGLSAVKMRIHRARLAFQRLFEVVCPGLRTSEVRTQAPGRAG